MQLCSKSLVILLSAFLSLSIACGVPADLLQLSDVDADAIIVEQFAKRDAAKALRLERLNGSFVLSEVWDVDAKGRTVIFRNVEAPDSKLPIAKPVASDVSSKLPANFVASATKPLKTASFSATVYDHEATRLRWRYEGADYVAWTNVDFNYLRGVNDLETTETNYFFLMGIGDTTSTSDEEVPILPALPEEGPCYMLTQGDQGNFEATAALDALLDYYAGNESELKVLHQRCEALEAARKRYLKANPPQPEPLYINLSPKR